ncbi:kinase-like domain-containing protein [Trichoderma velutinum]
MASTNEFNTSEFELLYETEQGIWFATKRNDYGSPKYIVQPLGILEGSDLEGTDEAKKQETADKLAAFYDLMHNLNQGPAIGQIFNHENIISIAGHIKTYPIIGAASAAEDSQLSRSRDYIVWDYCDAGNLSALFQSMPCKSPEFYLPESLCWHVLISLLNAITYLHDGKRLFLDAKAPAGEERQWLLVDEDWNPILHRAIEPRNIFFQHPRGSETYGLCKLANFEHAVVTNHVITLGDGPDVVDGDAEISIAIAPRRGFESLDTMRHKLRTSATADTTDNQPYTIVNELFSVGTIIFTMMTGRQFPFYSTSSMVKYSAGLQRVVMDLLVLHPDSKLKITKVLPRTKLVMDYYREWKNSTNEGKNYKDIEDDMIPRYEAEMMGKRENVWGS